MGRYAVINDVTRVVVNVIELEPDAVWTPPEGCSVVEGDAAENGGTFVDGEFVPPSEAEGLTARGQAQADYAAATTDAKLRMLAERVGLVKEEIN